MLLEDFLPDYDLTVAGLADAIGVSRQSINELLRGRRAVSPEMALRLARLFGNTPEFWLNAQRAVDLWQAAQAIRDDVARIKPLRVAGRRQKHPPVSRSPSPSTGPQSAPGAAGGSARRTCPSA
jgi:addiction module HigA family antidote